MFGERMIVFRVRRAAEWWRKGLIVVVVAFALWAAAGRLGEYITAGSAYQTYSVVVQPGDTVWSLAKAYGPKGWDVRKTVDVIQTLNGLSTEDLGRLQPGQKLQVPRKP